MELQNIFLKIINLTYKIIIKNILFLINPEKVHEGSVHLGEKLGNSKNIGKIISKITKTENSSLSQNINGITFKNPIGLAAGFDYEARLTQILPHLGFGFETVGTITDLPYEGNPFPMLGRLPKSKSLMVNKGFKNFGVEETIKKMEGLSFEFPLGISIGKTNKPEINTQTKAIDDIVRGFTKFEKSKCQNSYYELNISCPNLFGNVSFYSLKNLKELLNEIDNLKIKKPVFIKMPIEKTNEEISEILDVIAKSSIEGVIFGNLQKDRTSRFIDKDELRKFPLGSFSGKPTFQRSNELIALTYKKYSKRFTIIGCGGVFSGEDAFEKILLGASLVQLITGLVYEGPQLVSQINIDLVRLLKENDYSNIKEAIGQKSVNF